MYRLYCGNLDSRVTGEMLQNLFEENGLGVTNIVVKRGYAFVDCPDQTTLDNSIEKLNGANLMGSVMLVEPSTVSKKRRSNKIAIRGVPPHSSQDDIQNLVATFGTVSRIDLGNGGGMDSSVTVSYETPDSAHQAVEQLEGYDFQGSHLRVDYVNSNGRRNNAQNRPARNSAAGQQGGNRGSGYPLRILVPSDFVGAIIGRKGQTIRNITTQCKARIDVHRDSNMAMVEKVISIYGQPENCTNACKEIMLVMQQEATANNRGDVTLKMLADDRYCGRIIGKEGKVIKKIREETDTKITVSNVQEVAAMYPDRVISIRGTIDNMSAAEAAISTKLRECYDKEMQAPMPNMMMQNPMSNLPVLPGGMYGMRPPYGVMEPGSGGYYPGLYPPPPGGAGPHSGGSLPQAGPSQPPSETCQVSVPNSAVGAIIGAGGSNIKQIIRDSNAFVTIEPKKDDDPNPAVERIVTIKGNPDAIWRASFYVFEKLKQEGFAGNEDVRLRTAMKVPKSMVGRVIGKGGKNVRDIQRMTGSMIKLPEDQATQGDEVMVEVYGSFMATQSAHSRIRALVQQGQQALGGPPGPSRPRGPPQGEPRPPRNQPQN